MLCKRVHSQTTNSPQQSSIFRCKGHSVKRKYTFKEKTKFSSRNTLFEREQKNEDAFEKKKKKKKYGRMRVSEKDGEESSVTQLQNTTTKLQHHNDQCVIK